MSAAEKAALRRELRRRKILANQDNRLDLVLGKKNLDEANKDKKDVKVPEFLLETPKSVDVSPQSISDTQTYPETRTDPPAEVSPTKPPSKAICFLELLLFSVLGLLLPFTIAPSATVLPSVVVLSLSLSVLTSHDLASKSASSYASIAFQLCGVRPVVVGVFSKFYYYWNRVWSHLGVYFFFLVLALSWELHAASAL